MRVGFTKEIMGPIVPFYMGDGDGDLHKMEDNHVQHVESIRRWLWFVFTTGRLLHYLGLLLVDLWCMNPGIFLLGFFSVAPMSVVGDNHSLMGGSVDAFASWVVVSFFLFWPILFSFLWTGSWNIFIPPHGACPGGEY